MNANNFKKGRDYYINEFNQVLKLLIFSYEKMVKERKFDLKEWETFLRNILLKKLREHKSKFNLDHLNFYAEVEEINKDCTTAGFIDIHISNPMKILGKEDLFYAFECKRLDGGKSKNEEYINNGLIRFINGKYSKNMPLSGMIGFVQGFKKGNNMINLISDINHILNNSKEIKSTKKIIKHQINPKFEHSYYSQHNRNAKLPKIDLYHLFFDFVKK